MADRIIVSKVLIIDVVLKKGFGANPMNEQIETVGVIVDIMLLGGAWRRG